MSGLLSSKKTLRGGVKVKPKRKKFLTKKKVVVDRKTHLNLLDRSSLNNQYTAGLFKL